jgi:hypothetical protein
MTTSPLPAQRFRLGSITVTIWPGQDRHGRLIYTTSISRTVRDHTGRGEDAPLRPADLPVVRALTTQAEDWLRHQPQPEPRLAPLNPAFNRVRDSR